MEGNTVSAHNVHKVGHIYYKQRAEYGALWDQTNDVDDRWSAAGISDSASLIIIIAYVYVVYVY